MKKITLLTSILALAACATGDGPDDRFRVSSTSMYFLTTKDAVDSNRNVTSLKTEVPVCKGNCREITTKITGSPSHPSVLNRLSTKTLGANENVLTIYDLSDTEFKFVDGTEKFTFVIDDADNSSTYGKITGIKIGDSEVYERKPDDSAEFTKDDATFTYNSFSKSEEVNLLYSDFGEFKSERFVGGYKDLKQDAPTQKMTFRGRAVGVGTKDLTETSLDGEATLNFVAPTNKETLTMDFDNWDKVVITKEGDNARQIQFDGGNPTSENLNANVDYYGASASNIQEAVGNVKYNGEDRTLDVVFGVKNNN